MKNKNKKRLLLCLCCSLMLSTLPLGVTACTPDKDTDTSSGSSSVVDPFEGGVYYADVDGQEYGLTLADGVVVFTTDKTLNGTYTHASGELAITFSDGTTATATVAEGTVVLTYAEATYTFVEKIDYTVSFSVDGTVTSTATVVNGRTASKPADPEKEGYLFVGWYADSAFKTSYAFDAMPVTADTTLYARFVEKAEKEFECTVTLMVDGEAFETVETMNGVAYNLPTPTKEGAEFLGWWMSDYQDGEKLSRKYEEQKFEQDAKLFAVWKSDAIALSVDASKISWSVADAGVGSIYTITIKDPSGAETKKTQGNTSYDYDFSKLAAGDYEITVQDNKNATATVYFKNKALAQVSFFKVEDGNLIFNPVDNAEKYVISVVCGDETHDHAAVDNGTSTTYNFSKCKMQKGGIKFVVTAEKEGWTSSVSEEFVYSLDLAAVAEIAIDDANAKASWAAVENATEYKVELFAGETALETATVTACEFSLKNYTGALTIKVTPVTNGYNSPDATEKAFTKVSLNAPQNVRLQGSDIVWDEVAGAASYVIKIDGTEYTAATASFTMTDAIIGERESSVISVKTVGATADKNSVFSDEMTIRYNQISENVVYQNGKVTWEAVLGAEQYGVKVGDADEVLVDAPATSADITFTKSGATTIKVRSYGKNDSVSDWVEISVTAYKVSFNTSGGTAVSSIYKAEGDKVALSDVERTGYNFVGWYDVANGETGSKYETEATVGAENLTIYAHWSSKTYKVNLVVGEEGTLAENQAEVLYGQEFILPKPTAINAESMIFFGGWYAEPNGIGKKYADEFGNGTFNWDHANNEVTVYADWWHVLSYEEITLENGDKGYAVKAGPDVKLAEEITIPATHNGKLVAQITAKAFSGCALLKTVNIPNTIQLVEVGAEGNDGAGSAFQKCTALQAVNVYEADSAAEAVYWSYDGVLMFNNQYNGVELKFFPSARGGEYTIPEGVQTIPTNVFNGSKIETLNISYTVVKFDKGAFAHSTKLTTINFLEPDEGQTAEPLVIGPNVFSDCVQLVNVLLPARLDEIDLTTFKGCWALENINATKGEKYSSNEGFLCDASGETLLYASKYLKETVTIPEGILHIGVGAFEGSKYLESVIIPGYVQTIGERAFKDCKVLKSVDLGDEDGAPLTIESSAFYNTSLTSVVLPKRLVSLKKNAFGDTKSLTEVTLNAAGTGVKLENGAFASLANTYYVTKLTIGAEVDAFQVTGVFGGAKLSDVIVVSGNEKFGSYVDETTGKSDGVLYNKDITEIVYFPSTRTGKYELPDTVSKIGAEVFMNKNITEIEIGANVSQIGNYAFANCYSLTRITFKERTSDLYIGKKAFAYCTGLTELNLPVGTKEIGEYAFENCINIDETMVIPEGVTVIGSSAFKGCSKVTSLSLPSTLTTIAETTKNINSWSLDNSSTNPNKVKVYVEFNIIGIFEGAKGLESITVANGNQTYAAINGILYKKDANGNATELMYSPIKNAGVNGVVTVPSTVTKVWGEAFRDNDLLTAINFEANTADVEIAPNAFYDNDNLVSINLPVGLKTIEMQMFYGCAKLQKITVPNTVTKIRLRAFLDCASLEEIVFAPGGTEDLVFEGAGTGGMWYGYSYADDAIFNNCASLKNVTLPERTTEIGAAAFYGCTGLETVSVPKSVTTINKEAFAYCPNLRTVTFADDSALTSLGEGAFKGDNKLSTINFGEDSNLATIGASAFYDCSALTSITLPAGVTSIGNYAFAYTSLTSIAIPNEVTSIGNYAFTNNKKLASATLGTALSSIGTNAFENCTGLTTITIPSSVSTIGKLAFVNCTALTNLSFAEGTSSLTAINQEAFKNTAITQFIMPESSSEVKLDKYLFNGCRSLTKVHLSSKVTSITDVFVYSVAITNVSIAEGNQNLKTDGAVIYNYNNNAPNTIQYVCAKMDLSETNGTYTIPDFVTSIGKAAFKGHTEIKKLIIPAKVTSLATNAFENCTGLEEVVFADSFAFPSNKIPKYTFAGCISLKKLSIASKADVAPAEGEEFENNLPTSTTSSDTYAFYGCLSLTNLTLPSNFKTMANYMFMDSGLKSITLPSKVTKVTNYAFSGCTQLASISMQGAVTQFGTSAFADTISLTSINIPTSVTAIKANAFQGSGLTSVVIPDTVTSVEKYAFADCASLSSVTIGTGVTSMGDSVFENCTALSTVNFNPTGLTSVGKMVFKNCTNLVSITIPTGVQSIGATAISTVTETFAGCTNLTTVNLPDSCTKIGANAFFGCEKLVNINLSKLTLIGDSAFAGTGLTAIDLAEASSLGSNTFANCEELTTVTLNNMVASIPQGMFEGCTKLATVAIPTSVTSIGAYAFRGTALTEVTLNNTITAIDTYAFADCTKLAKVTLQGSVRTIAASAFENCKALTSFNFQASLTSIGASAFKNTGLTEVTLPKGVSVGSQAFAGTSISVYNLGSGTTAFYVDDNGIVYSGNTIVLVPTAYAPENGEFVIPEGYSVADGALAGCKNITKIVVPATLKTVTTGMFRGLTAVERIDLPEGVESIESYAFADCTSLKYVTIPSTVMSIGGYVFANSAVEEVVIPEGITSLSYTFYNAYGMKRITLPTTLETIGASAFENCGVQTLVIPEGVTSIGELAFAGSGLTSIVIPNTVTTMYNRVFMNCTSLQSATLSNGVEDLFVDDQHYNYGGQPNPTVARTFLGCTSLQTVVIPEGIKRIGQYTFQGCSSLSTVTLPQSLVRLDLGAFEGSGLVSITIPGTIRFEGEDDPSGTLPVYFDGLNVFANCTKLQTVVIEEGSTMITDGMFSGCTALSNVTLPESMDTIGTSAFANCTALKTLVIPANAKVTVNATRTAYGEGAFHGWKADQTIKAMATEYAAGMMWQGLWSFGSNATVVWGYTEAPAEPPVAE